MGFKFLVSGFRLKECTMGTIKRFEDLEIWQEARKLSKEIISISRISGLKTDFN